jgi:tetratricopeptide (TPR) repeat protein
MHMMNLKTMQIYRNAIEAARRGDKRQALELADRYAVESATMFITADPEGLAMIVAPLVNFYESLGEWELCALKSKDVCALAEKLCPDTTETAGDYTYLATALEQLKDFTAAIAALENAVRHLKGAGAWDSYASGYEKRIARLRELASPQK